MRKAILPLLFAVFSGAVLAQSVGVAPASISFGDIQRGETQEVTLYITSNADSPFNVDPSYESPFTSEMFSTSDAPMVSEEDISDWIVFPEESYGVTPDEGRLVSVGGSSVFANGNVTFEINVPRDAEPGIHGGRIRLTPQTSEGTGYGASVVTQSSAMIEFTVPGEVERNLQLVDVNAYRMQENTVRIDTQIRNRGTVTATANATRFIIENFVGENLQRISGGSVQLQPQESEWITSYWTGDDIQSGEYTLKGSVNYMTGSSFASRGFNVSESVNVTPPETPVNTGEEDQQDSIPLWMVAMFLALIGVLMYSFEIDPIWIVAITGFIGAAAFILMTEVSNNLLLVLLTSAAIIMYTGWN